jgi:Ras-related GTP-binding protein A/B
VTRKPHNSRRNVAVLIYVFDVESRQMKKDIQYFSMCIEALKANSDKFKVFCLVHKMDLVPADVRANVFAKQVPSCLVASCSRAPRN